MNFEESQFEIFDQCRERPGGRRVARNQHIVTALSRIKGQDGACNFSQASFCAVSGYRPANLLGGREANTQAIG